MRNILVLFIRAYQYLISPLLGPHCRFYPSCSSYAQTAVERHGVMRGSWLAVRRLSRCHPWHTGGEDPVPETLVSESKDPRNFLAKQSTKQNNGKHKCQTCAK